MTIANDILNRLSDDAAYVNGGFYTAVFTYGAGVVELCDDWGYKPTGPDEKVYIEIEADLGAAESYIEGQAMASPVESTTLEVGFTPKHFRGVIRESGHERRRRGSMDQGARVSDPDRKLKRCVAAIKAKIATVMDDAAAHGFQGLISQTTNFGNQDRSVYTKLKPYLKNASSAAVSTSLLNEFAWKSQDTPYGAHFDLCVASATQCHKIAELGSGKMAFASPDVPGGLNLVPTDLRIGSAPLIMMPNISTSTIFGLTGARLRPQGVNSDAVTGDRTWGVVWGEENPGRFSVLDLGANNTDTPVNLQISTCLTLVNVNPNQQGYMSALSTG